MYIPSCCWWSGVAEALVVKDPDWADESHNQHTSPKIAHTGCYVLTSLFPRYMWGTFAMHIDSLRECREYFMTFPMSFLFFKEQLQKLTFFFSHPMTNRTNAEIAVAALRRNTSRISHDNRASRGKKIQVCYRVTESDFYMCILTYT